MVERRVVPQSRLEEIPKDRRGTLPLPVYKIVHWINAEKEVCATA